MVQYRRTVFLFTCVVVFVQAFFYIIALQVKNNETRSKDVPISLLHEHESDIRTSVIYDINHSAALDILIIKQKSTETFSPFANISFVTVVNFSTSDPTIYDNLPPCNFSITNNDSSIYKVNVDDTLYSLDIVEQRRADGLEFGGHWFPKTCRPEQHLAVIICYRNRESHLKIFLENIHPFLQKQELDYTIFIVNQHGVEQFNRAALFNVGFLEAMKLYSFNCFIFHDVDLLPEDLRNLYRCGDKPRHMSVAVDKFNYKLLYSTLFGGVTAFSLSDFVGANGYPTIYWGWGGEDDDMYLRVTKKLNKSITRYPIQIARYKMLRKFNHTSGKPNPNRHTILYSKYNYDRDGINTTHYKLNQITFYKLFTLINVTLPEESFEQVQKRLNISKVRERKKPKSQPRKRKSVMKGR